MRYLIITSLLLSSALSAAPNLKLNDLDYFETQGLNVTVFADIYPDGHQTGVTVIQHGLRVAANGDIRLEASPGQWSPVPAGGDKNVDREKQIVSQTLAYPDESKNRKGFNPIEYPDLEFTYTVHVSPLEGNSFKISVDLDKPVPQEWLGKIGFNFELFPQHLFGKSWLMDGQQGIFPQQANGPIEKHEGEWLAVPLARGNKLVVAPEEDKQRMTIENAQGELELWDGRANHNNGWYIVRSLIKKGATKNAVEWVVTPNVVKGWKYKPVIQVSQLGYDSEQEKRIVIEQDKTDKKARKLTLYKLTEKGRQKVESGKPEYWGTFLRYNYFVYDFSKVTTPGMYLVEYADNESHSFEISADVYSRHAWQPTLEYYLPVQMCHMRVNEKYRVWHDLCHEDDARMSPVNTNHFDGYISGPSTLTKYKPLEPVPGLNKGGWHDAGDYDLRVESQMTTTWMLAMMIEEFGLDYDATLIDQNKKRVEIHQPDGISDAHQQVEHGLLSVLGAYQSLGRLYRGIITPTIRQYVLLGDAASQSDNIVYEHPSEEVRKLGTYSGVQDDRLVFTEENPDRELRALAGLAAASRVMRDHNPELAKASIEAAENLYVIASKGEKIRAGNKAFALAELALTTGKQGYLDQLIAMEAELIEHIEHSGWAIGRVMPLIKNEGFKARIAEAVAGYQQGVREQSTETPYGVPYKPHIWGAGWGIQAFAVRQYFFHQAWPQHTSIDVYLNALNFILGVHPGENTMSFASGVGSESAVVAYGVNRADWSYIPGGVISGTALIRPDLPELKIWPFFWQQTEYVMGGGATNYMFLVLAAEKTFQ